MALHHVKSVTSAVENETTVLTLTLLYHKTKLISTIHPLYFQHGRHCSRSANFFFL